MKKIFTMFLVVTGLLFCVFYTTSAYAGSATENQGSFEIQALRNSGNNITGSTAYINLNGEYRAVGSRMSNGGTDGAASIQTSSSQKQTSAKSSGLSVGTSASTADGNQLSHVSINGEAKQADWVGLGKDDNFATAGNKTTADFMGERNGRYDTNASGFVDAKGNSSATLVEDKGFKQATANTTGSSLGAIRMQGGDPNASGFGQTAVGLTMEHGATSAALYTESNANYSAQGPNLAGGSLGGNSSGTIEKIRNGVKVTASSSSSSEAFRK